MPEHDLNMDEIARIIRDDHGMPAYVEQTGGGTATIYAGTTAKDEDGDERWTAAAGPGAYGWGRDEISWGNLAEFCVGPDDNGEAGYVDVADIGCRTEADVAKVIAAQAKKTSRFLLSTDDIEDLGLDGTGRSTLPTVVRDRDATTQYVEIANAALRAAYDRGATPTEAVAAAKSATDVWESTL